MNPTTLFWAWALVNMTLILSFAVTGTLEIRRKNIQKHKQHMITAGALIVIFLISYIIKVLALGKENLAEWPSSAKSILYTHEVLVLVMLVSGSMASFFAYQMPRISEKKKSTLLHRHRRAGWIGITAGFLGLLFAAIVFGSMLERQ